MNQFEPILGITKVVNKAPIPHFNNTAYNGGNNNNNNNTNNFGSHSASNYGECSVFIDAHLKYVTRVMFLSLSLSNCVAPANIVSHMLFPQFVHDADLKNNSASRSEKCKIHIYLLSAWSFIAVIVHHFRYGSRLQDYFCCVTLLVPPYIAYSCCCLTLTSDILPYRRVTPYANHPTHSSGTSSTSNNHCPSTAHCRHSDTNGNRRSVAYQRRCWHCCLLCWYVLLCTV